MVAFHGLENMIQEAQEYVWILSTQILMSTQPLLVEAVKRGVEFRLILPEDMTPPPDYKPSGLKTELIKLRILNRIDVSIAMSEKEGGICFPTINGRLIYEGFIGTPPKIDERSHKWFKDLFLYYWERSKLGYPKGYPSPKDG
ncbi:MAG: hypothetical protein ACE5R6_03475 [Candidatus Heimdallarchaeota archaeon]